jgi:sugar phosphate isomerase/epimerase
VQVDFGRLKPGETRLPLFDPAHQEKILAAAAAHKVAIASLAMGVLNTVPYKSDAATEQWVLDSIGVMQRLKQRVTLLAFFSKGDLVDDEPGIAEVIRRLKILAPRAAAAGVVYGIESWLKAPMLERILDAVNSPAVRVYYDVGNMQKVGEDIGAAIRRLGKERICEVHLKDYDDLYGKGSINFPNVRTALDAAGYRGWLGIEGVKTPLGVEPSIKYDLDYLRPIFPAAT